MKQRLIKGIAGVFILSSVLLSIYVHQNWLWLAGFVGANLLQYAFTNWCMLEKILTRLGVKDN